MAAPIGINLLPVVVFDAEFEEMREIAKKQAALAATQCSKPIKDAMKKSAKSAVKVATPYLTAPITHASPETIEKIVKKSLESCVEKTCTEVCNNSIDKCVDYTATTVAYRGIDSSINSTKSVFSWIYTKIYG